jgi:hypothetical protein
MALVRCSTDPPLCICGCGQPVKRVPKGVPLWLKGSRLVDGVRWRWYASRACSGRMHGKAHQRSMVEALRESQRLARERRVTRLVAACKGAMGYDGRVDPRDMAKVLGRLERAAYARGWDAATKRQIRGAA